jgi:CRP-like cAMP-binding protein
MIKKLAPALREQLLYNSYGTFFKKTPFFLHNFSDNFLKELSEDIEEVRFSEGEIVFKQNDGYDDFTCFFIMSGKMELYLDAPKPIFLGFLREN